MICEVYDIDSLVLEVSLCKVYYAIKYIKHTAFTMRIPCASFNGDNDRSSVVD